MECKVDSLCQLLEKYHFSQGKISQGLVKKLYEVATNHPKNRSIMAMAVYWEAQVEFAQARYNATLIYRIDSLSVFFNKKEFLYEDALLNLASAMSNMILNNQGEAFKNGLQALEKFEILNNPHFIAKTLILLGDICPYIQNFNLADSYYDRAITYLTPDDENYYKVKMNKCRLLFLKGQYREAIDSMERFSSKIIAYQDTFLLAMAYTNLGGVHTHIRNFDQAYIYYLKGLDYIQYIDNGRLAGALYQNLGTYYLLLNQYQESLHWLQKNKDIAVAHSNMNQMSFVLLGFSEVYDKMGICDSSLLYLKEYNKLDKIIRNNPETVEVYQSYVSMLIESSENKAKIAEQELLLKNKQITVTVISAIAVISVIILILIINLQNKHNAHQRALLKEIENKDLTKKLFQEQQIQKLQSEKLEVQVREITSYSLLLANKNHLLNQILDLNKKNSGKEKEISEKISKLVTSNLNIDDDWTDFMINFDKVHPHFFDTLELRYPSLTRNDLKLCAYIRIKMTLKQIARILNISTDSVKKNRYRLKRKMNLQEGNNLDEFIQSI